MSRLFPVYAVALGLFWVVVTFRLGKLRVGVFRDGHRLVELNENGVWDGPGSDEHIILGQAGELDKQLALAAAFWPKVSRCLGPFPAAVTNDENIE